MPASARPSHAAEVMELGYDGVLLNTAIAKAADPVTMASAFAQSRRGRQAGLRSRADRAARHGHTLDARRRHALLQDRPCLLIDPVLTLDPFYPILPDTDWLRRLLPLGVKLVQLRIKDADPETHPRRDRRGHRALSRP